MKTLSWHMAVLIPARNEELLLASCLDSILQAKARVEHAAVIDVVVVSDSSIDRTSDIAADVLGSEGVVVSINAGAVGTARRIASHTALDRYCGPLNRCWFANTDADCVVPRGWLADQLSFAQRGEEAIAGIVSVDSFEEHGAEVRARFKSTYRIEPDGSHPHVHGANLGVRADAYLRAGGWQNLETAEDHDLWRRLAEAGVHRLSTSRIQVQTSGRRIGRAPKGFAEALAAHNETAA